MVSGHGKTVSRIIILSFSDIPLADSMLRLLVIAVVVAIVVAAPGRQNDLDKVLKFKSPNDIEKLPSLEDLWQDFKLKHSKSYVQISSV